MPGWKLGEAENIRNKLTKEQENEISKLYRDVYLRTRKQMMAIPKDGTVSQQIQRQYLSKLIKQLDEAYKSLGTGLEKEVKKQAEKAAQGVVDNINSTMSRAGLSMEGAYSYVAKDVVESIATGKVYSGNWSLSGAIWSDINKHQGDINRIVAEGAAANLSPYEIAKSLEQYVDPKAKKPWDWSKVYPGTSKKVDYNAQRLARTMVSHVYQQSLERVCKNNPFAESYTWRAAQNERTCPICMERNGQVYEKGKLPLDHPNGRCTFLVNMPSMDDVAERLGNWANGGADPELDTWCVDFMKGDVKQKKKEVENKDKKATVKSKAKQNTKAINYKSIKYGTKEYDKFDDYYRKRLKDLTDEQLEAMETYTGSEYIAINQLLRTGKFNMDDLVEVEGEEELREIIKTVTGTIEGIPCPNNITVYRRVRSLGDIAKHSKGAVYKNKQFISSTVDKKAYRSYEGELLEDIGDIEIEIRVPKGYEKGAYIHSVSMQRREYEFLFAPDTEFDIIEMDKKKVVMQAKM